MGKQSFENIRKKLAILILICLVMPLTAVAVYADQQDYEEDTKKALMQAI